MYGITRNTGSSGFGGYVNTPIIGPLSTSQTPNAMVPHNRGTLEGVRPTPPQFYPSQEPVNAQQNTNARQQYVRATSITKSFYEEELAKLSIPGRQAGRQESPSSSHVNYIAPMSSGMYLNEKKSVAVGKSAYKVGLPIEAPISSKNYYPSGSRSALRRARSSGSVAPAKKGSIYNTSLRTVSGGWGSVPRNTY
tara:strand:- start:1322 stop:1903 length:582 start_codon:yes stop_codon:yes gene_type:complete